MKNFVCIFLCLILMPNFATAVNLLPPEHLTCIDTLRAGAGGTCGAETAFYFDHNGKCGCLPEQYIIAVDVCQTTSLECEAGYESFSNLYQYRNHEGLIEIVHIGCGCFSVAETEKKVNAKNVVSNALSENPNVPCKASDLVTAIIAANSTSSTTLNLAQNCTYLINAPFTANDALPVIVAEITLIGNNTTIARDENASPFRIFTINNGATLKLKNIYIKNGLTAGSGGGIFNGGTLILEQSTLANNKAGNGGGLAAVVGSVTNIIDSLVIANRTSNVGGGAFIAFGEITVLNSRFYENTAPINGGAINAQPGGVITLNNSMIFYNSSLGLGGGLSNLGVVNINDSQVELNTASEGGGIATGNTNVNLSLGNIINNTPNNCRPLNSISGCVD